MSEPSDQSMEVLAGRAAAGDEEALDRLLWMHHGRLLASAKRKIGVDWQRHMEAEDLVQETYIEIARTIEKFDPTVPDAFYRWASRILSMRFIDHVRHLKRAKRDVRREAHGCGGGAGRSSHLDLFDVIARSQHAPSGVLRREDAVAAVTSCMAKLPDEHRRVVQRLHIEQASLAQVAAEFGRSEDAVRRLGDRAVERLARCVGRASRYLSQS